MTEKKKLLVGYIIGTTHLENKWYLYSLNYKKKYLDFAYQNCYPILKLQKDISSILEFLNFIIYNPIFIVEIYMIFIWSFYAMDYI